MTISTHELLPGPRYNDGPQPDVHLALFDVDNTLVPNASPELPSERFMATVHEIGTGAVGLATARQPQKAQHIIDAATMQGYSILSNGAQIYNGLTREMTLERPLTVDAADGIVETLQLLGIEHWVQDDGVDHRWLSDDNSAVSQRTSLEDHGAYSRARDLWRPAEGRNSLIVPQYQIRKPFVIVAHDVHPELLDTMHVIGEEYKEENVTTLVAHENDKPDGSKTYEVFFLDRRANKLTAMDEVSEITGVPIANMSMTGDGPNDTAAVAYAGTGVAMGNSVQATLDVATYIAPNMEQDGARIALTTLMHRL